MLRQALHIIELRGLAWRFAVKQSGSPRALNRITQSRMI